MPWLALPNAFSPRALVVGPAHDGFRTTCAGPCHAGHPRNGLFRLGVILGRIGRALADAIGLVEKAVAVAQRFLYAPVDRDDA